LGRNRRFRPLFILRAAHTGGRGFACAFYFRPAFDPDIPTIAIRRPAGCSGLRIRNNDMLFAALLSSKHVKTAFPGEESVTVCDISSIKRTSCVSILSPGPCVDAPIGFPAQEDRHGDPNTADIMSKVKFFSSDQRSNLI
jgi:hypothetical protein